MSEKSKNREELLRKLEVENRRSTTGAVLLLQAVTQRSGMNLTDLQCINILTSTGPITAGQLAETMGLTTGAVTGVINRMERMGYARREKDPDDGRRVVIRPVPEELERVGADVFGSYERRALDALVSEYDERDLAVIVDFMQKSSALTEEEIARIRAASEGDEEGVFATPLGSLESGRLVFANGASRLTLRAASGMEDLYRARFEGTAPKVEVQDATVTFRYPRRLHLFGDWRRHSEEVTLNAAVPWEVEVRGGASRTDADFTGLELTSFVLKGGISDLALTLPEPSGVIPIRLSGGAAKASIRRPAEVEARLSVNGGAATLTFDEQSFDAVGGKVRLQSPGYDGANDRYEIEVSGGASELTVQ
jgi:DNA-binding MarR family transcriptional regulator